MTEIIRSMPGPLFLVLYVAVAAGCIIAARSVLANDGTRDLHMPDPSRFGPYAVAYLRGGIPAVIQAALFALHHYDCLIVNEERKFFGRALSLSINTSATAALSELEQAVLRSIPDDNRRVDIVQDKELVARIQPLMAPIIAEMQQCRLVRSLEERSRAKRIALGFLTFMTGFGAVKLAMGLHYQRPVVFIVILLLLSILAFLLFVRPMRLQTELGISYLKSLSERLSWMKKSGRDTSLHPAYGFAVFGAAVLGNSVFDQYLNQNDSTSSSGCSGGCGGGGGGCGGCGGGGGD